MGKHSKQSTKRNKEFMKINPKVILTYTIPDIWYFYKYIKARLIMGDHAHKREELFSKMVSNSKGKKALQIGVRNKKYAPNWVSVDLYDKSDYIDFNYDIHNLKFKNNTFDYIACIAILEHVEDPIKAVKELYRVLKKGGEIWIEIPFNQPYHPSPNDYWRVTPEGMKILMKQFQEIDSGAFSAFKSSIYNAVFFYGRKQ